MLRQQNVYTRLLATVALPVVITLAAFSCRSGPSPAEFVVSDLSVHPTEVRPGEEATISVSVENVGGRPGTCNVALKIDGAIESFARNCILRPGETKTVRFTVEREETGSYSVDVNGLQGNLVVVRRLQATRIAFVDTDAESGSNIYAMDGDGFPRIQLTASRCADINPVWSPDGDLIAFESYRNGTSDIYLMNADGSRQTRLTFSPWDDESPSWSPDGDRIAYVSTDDGGHSVFVMNNDGSARYRVSSGNRPAWSPVGERIAFHLDGQLRIASPDGSVISIFESTGHHAWSPDGTRIASVVPSDTGGFDIAVVNRRDLSEVLLRRSRPGQENKRWPAFLSWSPDGNYLVFAERSLGYREVEPGDRYGYWMSQYSICTASADGSSASCVGPHFEGGWPVPLWSPHGDFIAVGTASAYDEPGGIYTMRSDGSGRMLLTDEYHKDGPGNLSWSPKTYDIEEAEQVPVDVSGDPQKRQLYSQIFRILGDAELTVERKRRELLVLRDDFEEDLVAEVIRHVPMYDKDSDRLIAFEAYLLNFASQHSAVTGAPIETDPVGAAMRIFFDPSPETIGAMTGTSAGHRQPTMTPGEFKCKREY